jgi:plastocyanin
MRQRLAGSLLLSLGPLILGGAFAAGVNAGGGCHDQGAVTASDSATNTIRIQGCAFGPTVTRVPVGAEVTFLNADEVPHNVVGLAGGWGTQADIAMGDRFSMNFTAAGIYPYECSLHPGMIGAIAVGDPETVLVNATAPIAAPPATPAETGFPVGIALAGTGGLAIGALGMGLLTRRRSGSD